MGRGGEVMRWSDANREYVQLSPIKKFLLFVLVFVGVIVLVRLLGPDPAKRGVTSPPVPDGTPIAQQQTSDPVGERRAYILRLREKFLDDGVNIEVSSEDSARQQIHLEASPLAPSGTTVSRRVRSSGRWQSWASCA